MLGIFAKSPDGQPIKTRLQPSLSRDDAERFYLASLADTLETASQVVERPTVWLYGNNLSRGVDLLQTLLSGLGLLPDVWERLEFRPQQGLDLGQRLENVFETLRSPASESSPVLLIGSDSPSLEPNKLRRALRLLDGEDSEHYPDLVLGPTEDGGYYAIGSRTPMTGVLQFIAWSTSSVLEDTLRRAHDLGLTTYLLEPWSDVDRAEDFPALMAQIRALRVAGNVYTARHTETFLRARGLA